MEVRLMLKDQVGRAAKDKHEEGIDCWGSAQKKDPGGKIAHKILTAAVQRDTSVAAPSNI